MLKVSGIVCVSKQDFVSSDGIHYVNLMMTYIAWTINEPSMNHISPKKCRKLGLDLLKTSAEWSCYLATAVFSVLHCVCIFCRLNVMNFTLCVV